MTIESDIDNPIMLTLSKPLKTVLKKMDPEIVRQFLVDMIKEKYNLPDDIDKRNK